MNPTSASATRAPSRFALDPSQRAVLDLPDGTTAAVLGAPGTGKTSTIVELVADRVHERGWSSEELLVLAPSRAAATALRDRISVRLGLPTDGPLARTANSLAFEIVRVAARAAGEREPRLLTGGEHDADIRQLLEGHIDDDTGPEWPAQLGPEVRRLRGFRAELRELMMRCTELGIDPARLDALGRADGRPEWVAAARFIGEYREVTAQSRWDQLDSSELGEFAAAAIRRGELSERMARIRLLVVDDAHEATVSTLGVLRAFAARGVAVIALGDPDVAANGFRGGQPDALGRLAATLGVPEAVTLSLDTVHRHGSALRELTARVTERIGTAAAGPQRRVAAVGPEHPEPILVVEAASPARQWAAVARLLREQHLIDGIPWSSMAVIVRSGAQIPTASRALALAEVPTRSSLGGRPLRDDSAARALLALVDVGIGRAELDGETASALLLGPFGGFDRLGLRRLRLALRAEELAGGGKRAGDVLLAEALSAPGRFATIDHRIGRAAERLAVTLAALRELADGGGTIEELLWLAWDRSGLAGPWREQALGSGVTAAEADRRLDGVLALFTAATRFVERQPGSPARAFLDGVFDAEVPEDTLSPQAREAAVLVTTASGTVGLEFELVAIAGLQDGVWPNLRLRGSLLQAQRLGRVAAGLGDATIDERRQVLDDELRMFALAVSRARRHVILAAVANDDEAPSPVFGLVPESARRVDAQALPPLTLRALTGRLRRELTAPRRSEADRAAAAAGLARLAAEQLPGAAPAQWHGLLEPSTTEPLVDLDDPEARVPVSPSAVEAFERSPLTWFIERIAGTQPSPTLGIGTILHWAMETATDPSVDALWAAVQSRWGELFFESAWLAEERKRATRALVGALAEYLADFERDGKTLVGAEARFTLDVAPATVNGSIDRVERAADGSVVIVDLKTGKPITSQARIDEVAQLGAYQLAYAEGVLDELLAEHGAHRPAGAKLVYVKSGKNAKLYREGVQPPLDAEGLEGFRTRIRQAAVGMAAASFAGQLEIDEWGGGAAILRLHAVRAVSSD